MINKKLSLMDSHEWLGNFWFSGSPGDKFAGILTYTPKGGITLSTVGPHCDSKDEPVTIHGHTHEAGEITLISALPAGPKVITSHTQQEKFLCQTLISGGHFEKTASFEALAVRLNNLDEFCYPQGFKLHDSYTNAPVLNAEIESFGLLLEKVATWRFAPPSISQLLMLDQMNEAQKAELDKDVSEVIEKHGVNGLTALTDMEYQFLIQAKQDGFMALSKHINLAYTLSNLFSVLMLKTIRPIKITLLREFDGRFYRERFPALLSMYLSDHQIKSLEKDKRHRLELPLTISKIKNNFQYIANKWHEYYNEDLNIVVSTLLNHINNKYDTLQHFILLLTSMEQFCMEENNHYSERDKYDWLINRFASDPLKKDFESYIPINQCLTIGEQLSNMRSCIVHPKSLVKAKYKAYKDFIRIDRLGNLCELIFILLIIALYEKLGIKGEAIQDMKNGYESHIKRHVIFE